MAVYKSTFCSPYNKSFDMGELVGEGDLKKFTGGDLPISVECMVDTSNTTVTGYSIDIYDEDGKSVFPTKEFTGVSWEYHESKDETSFSISPCPVIPKSFDLYDSNGFIERVYVNTYTNIRNGTVTARVYGRVEPTKVVVEYAKEDRVTMISDLADYLSENAEFYDVPNDDGVNSGVNGTKMFVPIAPNPEDYGVDAVVEGGKIVYQNTIYKNLLFYHLSTDTEHTYDILNTNLVNNGHSYSWAITLYQGVSKNLNGDVVFPEDKREYDIPIANGQVMGSNDYRIQTAPIEEKVSLLDKYIQPVIIPGLSYDPSHPLKWTKGSGDIQQYTKRTIIENYDSTYGYIYPYGYRRSQTSTDVINKNNNVNGYRIYKNGNDVENLTATDKVRIVWDGSIVDGIGGWEWEESAVSPSKSHWKSYYLSATKPDSSYTPFTNSVYYGPTVYDGDRILLNHTMQSINGVKYSGSPLNGVYAPSFSIEDVKVGDVVKEVVPVSYDEETGIYSFVLKNDCKYTQSVKPKARVFLPENGIITECKNVVLDRASIALMYVTATGINENCVCEIEYAVSELRSGAYKVSAEWYRTPDADSWGELSVKTMLATDGSYTNGFYRQITPGTIGVNENCEIPQVISGGSLNSTPFMFVPERPMRLYRSTADMLVGHDEFHDSYSNNYWAVTVEERHTSSVEIGTIDRVEFKMTEDSNYEIISATDYIYTPGDDVVLIKKSAIASFPYEIDVYFTQDDERDYTGLIFYNKFSVSDGNILYIRPFSGIEADMVYKESTNAFSPRWFKIEEVDTNYWFVRYNTAQLSLGMFETGDRYTINSFYRRGDYSPFGLYKNPTFDIKLRDAVTGEDFEKYLGTFEITSPLVEIYSDNYEQDDNISWRSYQFSVEKIGFGGKVVGTVVFDEKYDKFISQDFYGFDFGGNYVIKLVVKTNKGATIVKTETATLLTTENFEPELFDASAEFDADNSNVKISISGESVSGRVVVRRREVFYDASNGTDYKYITDFDLGDSGATIRDYAVLNGRTYEYQIWSYEKSGNFNPYTNVVVKVGSPGWTMFSTKVGPDGKYIVDNKDVWRFRYNASGGEHTVNMSRSQQDTLGRFQRIYTGKQNYVSGQVSSLIGREFIPAYLTVAKRPEISSGGDIYWENTDGTRRAGGYIESLGRFANGIITPQSLGFRNLTSNEAVDMIDKFNEFCRSDDIKVLKNEKGQGFVVQIVNNSYTNEDNMSEIPTTVNFSWVQIGSLDDMNIVTVN